MKAIQRVMDRVMESPVKKEPVDTTTSTQKYTALETLLDDLFSDCRQVPEEYGSARPENVPQVQRVDVTSGGYGACFAGIPGIGKTYAATALAFHAAMNLVEPEWLPVYGKYRLPKNALMWVEVPYLLARIRDSFRKNSGETEKQIIDECVNARVLLLDDLGAEKQTVFTGATLYTILSYRRNRRRYTIITTNQKVGEIEEWEPRIASRMTEMHHVVLPGKDWRRGKKGR